MAEIEEQEPEFDESQAAEATLYYMNYKAVDQEDFY